MSRAQATTGSARCRPTFFFQVFHLAPPYVVPNFQLGLCYIGLQLRFWPYFVSWELRPDPTRLNTLWWGRLLKICPPIPKFYPTRSCSVIKLTVWLETWFMNNAPHGFILSDLYFQYVSPVIVFISEFKSPFAWPNAWNSTVSHIYWWL